MFKKKYNENWRFWREKESFALLPMIPEHAESINLPHDAMIQRPPYPQSANGGNTGYRDGDIYIYAKTMQIPEQYKEKTLFLKLEGVYMNAFVYVNEQLAAKNPFGYTSFYVPLNDFINYGGENEVRVHARAGAMKNSRWYSGAGIYRDVYLYEAGLTYICPDGVQIRTEKADEEYAVLEVETELKNRKYTPVSLIVETDLMDPAGNVVAKEETTVILFEQEERKISQRIAVKAPSLWDAETPDLYCCVSKLLEKRGGEILDENREYFGIRSLQVDARRGLQVNGKCVKLRGACIHHDSGLLGSATYETAQYRQIKKLKEAGFNAVRMSHHPMAPAMLRACDTIGIYVMDETFDIWNQCKSDYDYGLYFQEWWEKDVTAMVRKDFNHPSVILYSVGNEIPEIGTAHGARVCHNICRKIKSLDSTRYTLASVNGIFAAGKGLEYIIKDIATEFDGNGNLGNVNDFMTMQEEHMDEIVTHHIVSKGLELACAATDIAGYNYMTARYEPDGLRYSQRVIVGSETYPPEIERNWKLVKKYPYVIGDFTWTGWDYIGEAGIGIPGYEAGEGGFGAAYPAQLAYCGDIDLIGFRRPMSYYREIVFGLRKEPFIAVQNPCGYDKQLIKTPWVMSDVVSSWNWKGYEEKPVTVEVYAVGDEVELLLNGCRIGRKKKEKGVYRTLFELRYKPGTLKAVVYERGELIGETFIQTTGRVDKLVLKPEPDYTGTDEGGTLKYIAVEVCDEQGNLVVDEDQKLNVVLDGKAEILGLGSGNPKPLYPYTGNMSETFQGRALIIIKSLEQFVKVTVKAECGMMAEVIV